MKILHNFLFKIYIIIKILANFALQNQNNQLKRKGQPIQTATRNNENNRKQPQPLHLQKSGRT